MTIEGLNSQEAEPTPELVFLVSPQEEFTRVKTSLKKYSWYAERGYKLRLPQKISEKLGNVEEINDEDISASVFEEFNADELNMRKDAIEEAWNHIKTGFFKNLGMLGLPIQDKYYISLTKYGTGGSYHLPNRVILNMERGEVAHYTITHEIVHLTIQSQLAEYGLDTDQYHWTKERIVDLIMNKFFSERQRLQRNPKNSEEIDGIFTDNFPDIVKIIKAVSEIK